MRRDIEFLRISYDIEWIEEGLEEYGQLWAAHITDDGMILCYEYGYKFAGNVPARVMDALEKTTIDVYQIKFLPDGTYFIADKNGRYDYWM